MPLSRQKRTRFVVCVENTDCPASLELHKIYQVIPDEDAERDGDLRIVDESGEDYLYSRDRFLPMPVPAAVKRFLLRVRSDSPELTGR